MEHAVGSVRNPMSDAMIEDKFRGLCEAILPSEQAQRTLDLCRRAETLADAGDIARSAAGGSRKPAA